MACRMEKRIFMLKIYFGDMADVIYNTSVYFKNRYRREWITDPNTVKMIRDVDSSKVLGNGARERYYCEFAAYHGFWR